MFARRLKLFLLLILLGAMLLALRAGQVQIGQYEQWRELAARQGERRTALPPQRGRILDRNGEVLAQNAASWDLAVDYRVISFEPDARWLADEVRRRLRSSAPWRDAQDDAQRNALIEREKEQIRYDLDEMWDFLASAAGRTREQMDEVRQDITARVERRRALSQRLNYAAALKEFQGRPAPRWYERLLGSAPTEPTPEEFSEPIAEQISTHVVVPDISPQAYNEIGLRRAQFLTAVRDGKRQSVVAIRDSTHREYPLKTVACHVIGMLRETNAEDLENDLNKGDDALGLRRAEFVGAEGVEALAEPLLRGRRGALKQDARGEMVDLREAAAGADATLTIDSRLQARLEAAFSHVEFQNPDVYPPPIVDGGAMNGAAVVIDVQTNEVLALVSVPTYDLNLYREELEALEANELDAPLRNRALLTALEPGSTVKPIVGMGAIAWNLVGVSEKIACTGYPIFGGRKFSKPRCWTQSGAIGDQPRTHADVPWNAPMSESKLNFSEATERSCNVYFENAADRLGVDGLSYWMRQFGLGQRTGIGLPEARGLVPADSTAELVQSTAWYAGIGQGPVNATPIQQANVVATIARNGIRMRPRLLRTPLPTTASSEPDSVDLNLPPAALKALHEGMRNVVHSPGGTGNRLLLDERVADEAVLRLRAANLQFAAKTGSATASRLMQTVTDDAGQPLFDEEGRPLRVVLPYGSVDKPNLKARWYRYATKPQPGVELRGTHSWVIGYAPAENPKIAFCVLVEYGGSGQVAAGSVTRQLLVACLDLGYLQPGVAPLPTPAAPTANPGTVPDLLIDDLDAH